MPHPGMRAQDFTPEQRRKLAQALGTHHPDYRHGKCSCGRFTDLHVGEPWWVAFGNHIVTVLDLGELLPQESG
jgi:hypothetical protein